MDWAEAGVAESAQHITESFNTELTLRTIKGALPAALSAVRARLPPPHGPGAAAEPAPGRPRHLTAGRAAPSPALPLAAPPSAGVCEVETERGWELPSLLQKRGFGDF